MASYLERFKTMVNEIYAHPYLEVIEFSINPPASDDVFPAVADKLGAPLAKPIYDFYKSANGLRLCWKIGSDLTEEKLDEIEEKCDDYDIGSYDEGEDEEPFAQINLIPIEESIISRDWVGTIIFPEMESEQESIEFGGMTYDQREFEQQLRPFDLFSKYSCMAFLLAYGEGNPKVLRLSDYYVEWDNSRITDFASYIEMLLATRGIVDARERIYSKYRGDRDPALISGRDYWTEENIPKLFKLA